MTWQEAVILNHGIFSDCPRWLSLTGLSSEYNGVYEIQDTVVGGRRIYQKKNKKTKIEVQRFKGLGEMNASQLRETTMLPGARRLVQLTVKNGDKSNQVVDMLLSKKRSQDRKEWLEDKGNLANV